MSAELLTWSPSSYGSGESGKAGRLTLFGVHFGVMRTDTMWSLSTDLPIKSPLLGQHYPTPTHAKVAAERLLRAFLREIGGDR